MTDILTDEQLAKIEKKLHRFMNDGYEVHLAFWAEADIPALLATVRHLQAENERLRRLELERPKQNTQKGYAEMNKSNPTVRMEGINPHSTTPVGEVGHQRWSADHVSRLSEQRRDLEALAIGLQELRDRLGVALMPRQGQQPSEDPVAGPFKHEASEQVDYIAELLADCRHMLMEISQDF